MLVNNLRNYLLSEKKKEFVDVCGRSVSDTVYSHKDRTLYLFCTDSPTLINRVGLIDSCNHSWNLAEVKVVDEENIVCDLSYSMICCWNVE